MVSIDPQFLGNKTYFVIASLNPSKKPIPQHCSIPNGHHWTAPTSLLVHILPVIDSHQQDAIENHVPLYTTHPDDSVQMSGDGESEEGITVEPLIQFVSIPANSLQALHKSVKCRIRLTTVDTAASVITTIMPADGVDTSPNVINIAGKRHRKLKRRDS